MIHHPVYPLILRYDILVCVISLLAGAFLSFGAHGTVVIVTSTARQ